MRIAIPALFLSAAALAQTGESISLASDYRFRGLSLNDDKPDMRVDFAYDDPDNWYAGASLTRVKPYQDVVQGQVLAYGGWRDNLSGDTDWEAGVSLAGFTRTSRSDYAESYVGLLRRDWSARLYVSPNYYGGRERTLYVEGNFNHALKGRLYLTAHVGALTRLGPGGPDGSAATRIDGLVGIGTNVDGWNVQLAWNAVNRSPYAPTQQTATPAYPPALYGYTATSAHDQPRQHAWVLSASLFY